MYDIKGLKHGIEQCHKHIKTFEEAIEKERQTIKEYIIYIDELEKQAKLKEQQEG